MKSTYSIRAFSIPRSTITSFRNQTLAILLVCIGNDLPVLFAEGNHFQGEIAPIITRRCLECHDEGTKAGGLDLTSRSSAMAGGESGPALVVGKPGESLLFQRVHAGEMPPEENGESKKLPVAEITKLQQWIHAGAVWPAELILNRFAVTSDVRAGWDWWSLQPVSRAAASEVRSQHRVANPIDAFVLENLENHDMEMAPPATRRQLIRRVYFDLLGLPPTPEQVDTFIGDDNPQSYELLVDQLLESQHYGERWARHWLDVVRFAESGGYERDPIRPKIWRYRDWVISAFNDDMSYDRFVAEQLAGDEVSWRDEQTVIATGMIRAGTWNDEPNDPADYLYERLEDMVHVSSSAFLGLTVKCARCHDHKFDPIKQTDYYRMASFFWAGYIGQSNLGGPSTEQLGFDVFGWTDKGSNPEPFHLLIKGERHRPGPVVEPGFLSAISDLDLPLRPPPADSKTSHRRLQFAQWITDKRNPLAARVFVNRLWQHHFGNAIVRSPNNFGFKSDPPTHPQLLDWLAAEFMDGEWQIKRLHKLIMLSNTYQQSSQHPQQKSYEELDFENRRIWRQNRRRLDAESLRDAMLAVNGQLNRSFGGEGFYPRMSSEALEGLSRKGNSWGRSTIQDRRRRSIYMVTKRSRLLPLMKTFDFADTTLPCAQRDVTTVAPQALALMNNHFVHSQSRALAQRVADDAGFEPRDQVVRAWRLTLGRSPSAGELSGSLQHLHDQQNYFVATKANQLASDEEDEDLQVRENLQLWLRADKDITVDDEGGVMFWRDQSRPEYPARFTASQPDPQNRPRLKQRETLGGQPAVHFDGDHKFLQLAGQVLSGNGFTVIAVVTDESSDESHREILSNWRRADRTTTSLFLGTTGNGRIRFSDQFNHAGDLEEPTRPLILTAIKHRQTATTYQNRQLLSQYNKMTEPDLNAPYVIGAQGDLGGEYWQGDLAELLVYRRTLSEKECEQVWNYLANRYSLSARKIVDPTQLALESLCHVLLNTNEFIYVD